MLPITYIKYISQHEKILNIITCKGNADKITTKCNTTVY